MKSKGESSKSLADLSLNNLVLPKFHGLGVEMVDSSNALLNKFGCEIGHVVRVDGFVKSHGNGKHEDFVFFKLFVKSTKILKKTLLRSPKGPFRISVS